MQERLKKEGYKEIKVEQNNCQMRALAHTLYDTQDKHREVRRKIAEWLDANERFQIDDGGSVISDFLDRDDFPTWKEYVKYIKMDGTWGDHLSLVAAANAYRISIHVLSDVEGTGDFSYWTVIEPKGPPPQHTVYINNYHEQHFNALVRSER